MKRSFLAALLLTACLPTDFDDLRGDAPTVALPPLDDYPVSGYGSVVTGYAGMANGQYGSRVGVSAGADSPFSVYPLLLEDEVRLTTPILDGCHDSIPCERGAGVSLIGMPVWGMREMCLAVAEPESGFVRIRCEDDTVMIDFFTGPSGERFGEAAAAVPVDHPFGRAIFGAPGALGGRGAVYIAEEGRPALALDLSEGFGAASEIGSSVALGVLDADSVIVAASAPNGATKRVIVTTTDVLADGTRVTRANDCLDAMSDGWGAALAFGDLNGDGVPELAVGSGEGSTRLNAVRVYDGAALPPDGTCDGSWPHIDIACPAIEDASCDTSSFFGASVAIGDLDGDGIGELLVGAPQADVDGVNAAGAVFVFRGAATLDALSDAPIALRHSSPSVGANLGASVAVAPGRVVDEASGRRRDEAIAGAPGADRAYVFLCSGLSGDSPESTGSVQCQ